MEGVIFVLGGGVIEELWKQGNIISGFVGNRNQVRSKSLYMYCLSKLMIACLIWNKLGVS